MGKSAPLTRAVQLALVRAHWPMENQITVSDIRPHSNWPPNFRRWDTTAAIVFPADELLPGVKQLWMP